MHDFRFQFLALLPELLTFCIGLRVVHRQLVMSRHVWLCLVDCLDMTRRVLIGLFRKLPIQNRQVDAGVATMPR